MNTKLRYKDNSLLIVLSGPSGAGKGTLKNLYMQDFGENTYFSVSATTRAPRYNERPDIDYTFVSKDVFEEMIKNNEFLEYAPVHDNYYGTPRKKAMEEFENGKDVIFDIDVQGGINIKKQCPHAIMVFIAPPDMGTLERRLRLRGTDSEETIQKRMKNANGELDYVNHYDYIIINDSLDEAYEKLKAIIKSEKCKAKKVSIEK